MMEIKLNQQMVEELNANANEMSDGFDAVINAFVGSQNDNGMIPFIVLTAMSNVLTKIAMIMDCKRENAFDLLNDLVPSNEELEKIKAFNESTVIPESDYVH
jgi:hypothetical protein